MVLRPVSPGKANPSRLRAIEAPGLGRSHRRARCERCVRVLQQRRAGRRAEGCPDVEGPPFGQGPGRGFAAGGLSPGLPGAENPRVSAPTSPIDSLLFPASVAVVGASPSSYVGRVLCENLRAIGYSGQVYPVNPKYREILGWTCYGSVGEIPDGPEAVVAAVDMGPRFGFSAIVSCGTEAVTTVGDYLRYFAADAGTGTVALFLEGFRDPDGFMVGARMLREAGKPLAVLQAGRSKEAAAAVTAHSGTLAGTDEAVTGLLHQLGAIGV